MNEKYHWVCTGLLEMIHLSPGGVNDDAHLCQHISYHALPNRQKFHDTTMYINIL